MVRDVSSPLNMTVSGIGFGIGSSYWLLVHRARFVGTSSLAARRYGDTHWHETIHHTARSYDLILRHRQHFDSCRTCVMAYARITPGPDRASGRWRVARPTPTGEERSEDRDRTPLLLDGQSSGHSLRQRLSRRQQTVALHERRLQLECREKADRLCLLRRRGQSHGRRLSPREWALLHDFTVTDPRATIERARAILTPRGLNAYTNDIFLEKVANVAYEEPPSDGDQTAPKFASRGRLRWRIFEGFGF